MSTEYMLVLFVEIISSRQKCGLFCSVFKKVIPNNTTPSFLGVGGVT